jgi:hypothetical protein
MATTISYQMPIAIPNGAVNAVPILAITAGATEITDGAFVKLSSNTAIACVAGDSANILGIIQGDSFAVFNQITTGLQGVFGSSQVNTGLFPATPGQVRVATLGSPILVEGNLAANTGWISGGTHQAVLGTAVGLNLDATSGFYYFDTTQTEVGTVVGVMTLDGNVILGPPAAATPQSPTGLLGARVLVSFLSTVLAVQQGS